MATPRISLREVTSTDVAIFYEHQRDPRSMAMAAMPARDRKTHRAHWARITEDPSTHIRTVVANEQVVGNILSWVSDGRRLVGYWIDRAHWGKGIATQALELFLGVVTERPLLAYVAKNNVGSIRVLERNGFTVHDEQIDGDVELFVMELK